MNIRFLKEILIGFSVCALGILFLYHPILLSGFQITQYDTGDSRFNHYILEHSYQWLIGLWNEYSLHRDIWSPPFFFPHQNVGAYSDILLGAAPFYWIIRSLFSEADTAFQVWMILLGFLNFFSAWIFLKSFFTLSHQKSLSTNDILINFGAFFFAFYSYRSAQISHIQLHIAFYTPLALLFLKYFVLTPKLSIPNHRFISAFYLFLVCIVLQFYSGFYLGWFLAFILLITIPFTYKYYFLAFKYLPKIHLIIGSLFFIVSMSWLFYPYFKAISVVGLRSYGHIDAPYISDLFNFGFDSVIYGWFFKFLYQNPSHFISQIFEKTHNHVEHVLGLGFSFLFLVFYGAIRSQEFPRLKKILIFTSILIFLLSFRIPIWFNTKLELWRLVYFIVPGAKAIRALARIELIFIIPLIFLAILGLKEILIKHKKLAYFLVFFAVLEQFRMHPTYDKLTVRAEVNALQEHLLNTNSLNKLHSECSSFLYAPTHASKPLYHTQLTAMWASLLSQKPTLNGYSGNFPPAWPFYEANIQGVQDIERIERALHDYRNEFGLEKVCVITKNF